MNSHKLLRFAHIFSTVANYGNIFGLADDDHPQYVNIHGEIKLATPEVMKEFIKQLKANDEK